MVYDKELEIQLQFLEEAQEYLRTLESQLLGLAQAIDADKINEALRAAHSIKGGAGLMGFQSLSDLAHRLEDGLKVLKVQRQSLDVDGSLEQLLLACVDGLGKVIACDRQSLATEGDRPRPTKAPDWLLEQIEPAYQQLYERLGTPQDEDAYSLLSPEDGQDIIPLLFETEVEGCLQRLEAAIHEQSPRLKEEVEILAQELEGLGEMLQLESFSQLCQSIGVQIAQTETADATAISTLAQAALQAWRRAQALVLTGNLAAIPTELRTEHSDSGAFAASWAGEMAGVSASTMSSAFPAELHSEATAACAADHAAMLEAAAVEDHAVADYFADQVADQVDFQFAGAEYGESAADLAATEISGASAALDGEDVADFTPSASQSASSEQAPRFEAPAAANASGSFHSQSGDRPVDRPMDRPVDRPVIAPTQQSHRSSNTHPTETPQDNTVRVSVQQLNQLSDLFGELTIDRNALSLYLKRLRNLTRLLNRRVKILEQASSELRTTYDRLATDGGRSPRPSALKLLPSSETRSAQPGDRNRPAQPSSTLPNSGAEPNSNQATDWFPQSSPSSAPQPSEHRLGAGLGGGFDALELDRYEDVHLLSQDILETIVQVQEVTTDIDLTLEEVEQASRTLDKTANQLQSRLTQVRMRPLSDLVDRFPRALRELCLQHGKKVRLQVNGASTLIDRNILEALNDPLMHLLRNAFDHGIEDPQTRLAQGKPEEGVIKIQAFHRGNRTFITIQDDGQGIPLEKIRAKAIAMGLDPSLLGVASEEELVSLIFEPGFSTKEQVTSLSGRGVGMDVVRDHLKQIRGDIKVETKAGYGTTFTLSVPFTMSVVRVLIAESNDMLIGFPSDVIGEMLKLEPEKIVRVGNSEMLNVQGNLVPLVVLSRWLRFPGPRHPYRLETPPSISEPVVLLVEHNNQIFGIQIESCWGEQETAVRRIKSTIPLPAGFSNCTILGDGRVVPLVNIPELLHWIASASAETADPPAPLSAPLGDRQFRLADIDSLLPGQAALLEQQPAILVIDDSINVRRFLALTLEKAGYQVEQAKDGQEAVEKLRAGLQVNAVVCDIEMPRLDGYGFLAKVKSDPQFEHLPVTMLTSRTSAKHRQLALSLGAIAYFSKPYNEQTLLSTLAQHIHGSSELSASAAL
ncbi:response regulator [Thermoleptolyngbya sp. C42_A2020_037]|uniref:hybrid sensor histidine kinase/response regulator n=1 Tax=Thermoleptolyngbya sp. C42_A2020_037 TaxID=2747799 RepID=UPI0019DDF803|nr:response regulator [Thermoleptolyngbya sp. C42_A2020_037]MBF2085031.1 response regulator [Thermoleptolyngbya sp. C42_A2020_037]